MINILPPDVKDNFRYARHNVVLRRWLIAMVIAFVGLIIIATYGLLAIQQSIKSYDKEIAIAQGVIEDEEFTKVQDRVKDIGNNFKLVVKVLEQEVLFSKLLTQIAATIPDDASLTGLTINQVQGGIDISAVATNYNTATQVQVNLSDPANKIFSRADIVNINCSSAESADQNYPCTVNIRALFATDNPFLFINNKQATP